MAVPAGNVPCIFFALYYTIHLVARLKFKTLINIILHIIGGPTTDNNNNCCEKRFAPE